MQLGQSQEMSDMALERTEHVRQDRFFQENHVVNGEKQRI